MVRVTYIEHDGSEHEAEVEPGTTLMMAARTNNVPGILADCGGACACATCHVMVGAEWLHHLPEISPEEEAMLEFGLEHRADGSRLSCQLIAVEELDGIVLRLPEFQA